MIMFYPTPAVLFLSLKAKLYTTVVMLRTDVEPELHISPISDLSYVNNAPESLFFYF